LEKRLGLTVLSAVCALVFGAAAGDPSPASQRAQPYAQGGRLLDRGENQSAISFYKRELQNHPSEIAAVDGLLEAMRRMCQSDEALAWIDSALSRNTPSTEAQTLHLRAQRMRLLRDFDGAARWFDRAADASLESGDSLAAAVCLRGAARCAAAARDGERTASAAESLQELASPIGGAGMLRLDAVVSRGDAANLGDRLQEADSLYRHALSLALERGYREVQSYARNGLGRLNEKRQYYAEAAAEYGRALDDTRALGDVERSAKLLNDLGQSETRGGDLAGARAHFEESMNLSRSCGADWVLGYIYYGLGALAEAEGDFESATAYFRQSSEQHASHGNRWSELGARLRLAYRYMNTGEYAAAIEQYDRCLDFYEATGSLYGMGWALAGLGVANHRLGDLNRAQVYYRRALEAREKLGDKRGAAWCLNSLGMTNDLQGNYRQALEFEHRAMEIYEELGDVRGVGSVLFSMGCVYYYLGNFSKSLEHYEAAYAVATDNRFFELRERVASGMGSVYHAAGRSDIAESFYLEHLKMARDAGDAGDIVWSLNNIASLYLQLGDRRKARVYIDEATSLLPDQGLDHLRATTLYLQGKAVESVTDAIDYTGRALALAESNGLKERQWKCLTDLGEYYLDRGDTVRAKNLQERAIREVESLRRVVASDELSRHMLRPAMTPYERMVSMTVGATPGKKEAYEAFNYAERAKAQIFASLLREALDRIGKRDGADRGLRPDLTSKLSHILSRLQNPGLDGEEKGRLIERMKKVERDLLREEMRTAARREGYAAALHASNEAGALVQSSLRPNETMLSYFLGQRQSYLFAVKSTDIRVYVLPDRSTLEEKVDFYIRLLSQLAGGDAGLPAEVIDDASEELFNILIGPAAGLLDDGDTIVLVPDGALNRLPFALLRFRGAYLIDTHPIFLAPSGQSLYYLRQRHAQRIAANRRPNLDLIAVGSSGIQGEDNGAGRVYPLTDIAVEKLPGAEREARRVAAAFRRSVCLIGSEATERAVKNAPLQDANVIHIAAHSYVDYEDVRRSFVVLSREHEPPGGAAVGAEDGLLQWHEIAGLRLNASLVTLSACRSAGGVLSYGEGITGLTQAFLYAGGDCVLASFVDVPDRFAGRFMEAFYNHLTRGMSGAEALRATQLEAAGWDYLTHGPALWGSFALIGDGGFLYP
jgi:CHAT domain-containing protein/tetratricopeptide (TPR) repeat protein